MSHTEQQQKGIEELKQSLPDASWSDDPETLAPYLKEWRDRWEGNTPLLLLPKTTEEVSKAVRICAKHSIPITVQGGNTGLVGGQIPQGEVLLSTRRMQSVRLMDNETLTVEAGCILHTVQNLANNNKRLFPLSLASEGSATIGGLCSTNAGGVHVVRYGSMRDLVLGLEVVLADGSILNTMGAVKKDNTGFNLTSLFLGAEGTLGIITAAQLKTVAKPVNTETIMVGMDSVTQAVDLLRLCQSEFPNELSMIEMFPQLAMEFVTKHIPGTSSPFEFVYAWYVLLEFDFYNTHKEREKIEKLLSTAMEKNIIKNAVIAKTLEQAAKLKNLREHISAAQKPEGASVKHDISVPIDKIPGFIIKASIAVTGLVPSSRPLPFGHVGDGNIHFNVSQPPTMNPAIYLSKRERMTRMVHDIVDEFGGSISAEHGIGIVKKEELAKRADKTKMHSMRQIKQALDPDNLMNPRVLFT